MNAPKQNQTILLRSDGDWPAADRQKLESLQPGGVHMTLIAGSMNRLILNGDFSLEQIAAVLGENAKHVTRCTETADHSSL